MDKYSIFNPGKLININNMITYSLKDSGIFYVNFSGEILVDDIKKYLLEFKSLTNLPQNFLSLYDLRSAVMKLSAEDIAYFGKLSEEVTAPYKSVKTAFLVNKPKLTAYSFLFSTEHNSEKTTRLVFTNKKDALDWLIG